VMYIIITAGLLLRVITKTPDLWFDYLMVMVVMVFFIILCHEFGHCFAARKVDGEADEILMWPLGGLAYCSPPHQPTAHLITALGGPLVNLLFCFFAGIALLIAGFVPPLNPLRAESAYDPVLYNYKDGLNYGSQEYPRLVKAGTTQEVDGAVFQMVQSGKYKIYKYPGDKNVIDAELTNFQPIPTWALWVGRFFYLNWFLMLLNVLTPAYPMDGGRILQCLIWSRKDYETGTRIACYSGQIVGMGMMVASLWFSSATLVMLAVFIWYSSYIELKRLYETEGDGYYDSSKGYLGFGEDEEEQRKPKPQVNPVRRWLQARTARRIQKEIEDQQADDARLDTLLDKIAREGKASLNAEERKFLEQMSQRERNKRAE
jgi:stage IV sporulation protein FB